MPPVIAIVAAIGSAIGAAGAAVGAALGIGAAAGTLLVTSGIMMGVNMGLNAIFNRPPSIKSDPATSQLSIRQPITYRRVVYGKVRLGGTITYISLSGTDNSYLHLVITLSGHRVQDIKKSVWIDGTEVTLTQSGNTYLGTGQYNGFLLVEFDYGDPANASQPFPVLNADVPTWTNSHLQRGCAKVHLRLKWDQDVWPNGLPQNIAFEVTGKKVYDPRTDTVVYSNNPALCLRDFLRDTTFGMGATAASIDDNTVIAAANICEEAVSLKAGGTQPRYTCDGAFTTDVRRGDVIRSLAASMAGIVVPPGDKWRMWAGAWRSSVLSLTDADLRGPIKYDTRVSRRDLANGIKGTYVSPANNWEPSDFPPYQSSTYVTEDGEQIWTDIAHDFTIDPIRAQRLAKIELEKTRRRNPLSLPCKLSAFPAQPGDVISFTHTRWGFASKTFLVTNTALVVDGNQDAPSLGVDLALVPTDVNVYAWDPNADEGTVEPVTPPNVPRNVAGAPSGLAVVSVDLTRPDGIKKLALHATWTPPTDPYVLSGGHIACWIKKSSEGPTAWKRKGFIDGGDAEFYFEDNIVDGTTYDVRINSVSPGFARSPFVEVDNIFASTSISALYSESQQVLDAQALVTTNYASGDVLAGNWTAANTITIPGTLEWDIRHGATAGIVEVLLWASNDGSGRPNGYSFRCDGRSGQRLGQILKFTGGVFSNIGTFKAPVNGSDTLNQWTHMAARIDGNGQLNLYANGIWQVTATDTTWNPTGQLYYSQSTFSSPTMYIAGSKNKSTSHSSDQLDVNRRALIDFTQTGHSSKNVDNIGDGTTYKRTTVDEKTGAGRAFTNINSDNTYDTLAYHSSAFRQKSTTTKSGLTTTQGSYVTVASFVLHIPSGYTQYKGTLTVTLTKTDDLVWTCRGRINVGSINSNVITFSQPTLTANGTVTLTGLTPDTDITVNVQVNFTTDGSVPKCTGSFAQNTYVDQDTSNLA